MLHFFELGYIHRKCLLPTLALSQKYAGLTDAQKVDLVVTGQPISIKTLFQNLIYGDLANCKVRAPPPVASRVSPL